MINQYTQFQSLIKKSFVDVVTITDNNGNGTSTAETAGGDTLTVIGESVGVGNKAFIKDGVVERQAPNLPLVTLDV